MDKKISFGKISCALAAVQILYLAVSLKVPSEKYSFGRASLIILCDFSLLFSIAGIVFSGLALAGEKAGRKWGGSGLVLNLALFPVIVLVMAFLSH